MCPAVTRAAIAPTGVRIPPYALIPSPPHSPFGGRVRVGGSATCRNQFGSPKTSITGFAVARRAALLSARRQEAPPCGRRRNEEGLLKSWLGFDDSTLSPEHRPSTRSGR